MVAAIAIFPMKRHVEDVLVFTRNVG